MPFTGHTSVALIVGTLVRGSIDAEQQAPPPRAISPDPVILLSTQVTCAEIANRARLRSDCRRWPVRRLRDGSLTLIMVRSTITGTSTGKPEVTMAADTNEPPATSSPERSRAPLYLVQRAAVLLVAAVAVAAAVIGG